MRKNKKPAIASEWREDKEAEARAREEARLAARREFRRKALAVVGRFFRALALRLGWMVAIVAGVLAAAALASYTPEDAGFSTTGAAVPANLCGLWGAWSSDALYWGLGLAAWWVPAALLIYSAVWLHMALTQREEAAVKPFSTAAGLVILAGATAGLSVIEFSYAGVKLPMGSGGLLGRAVAANTAPFLGVWGATFVLSVLILAGASWAFHFSWLTAAEKIGGGMEEGVARIRAFLEKLRHREKPVEEAPATEEAGLSEALTTPEATEERLANDADAEAIKAPAATAARTSTAPGKAAAAAGRVCPEMSLLDSPPAERKGVSDDALEMTSRQIESKLQTYKIQAHVERVQVGPVITQYQIDLAPGVKSSKVEEVKKDLVRALAVQSLRIVSAVPGTTYMGLEIPNQTHQREQVYLSEILESRAYQESASPLTIVLGKDIGGAPVVTDLAKLPHLLVGGTTGSGKSVAINTMILSLLYKCDPSELRLVMVDPKQVEFVPYNDIPHLLCPVVDDMNKAANALNWLVQEMEHRYKLMKKFEVRNFIAYNDKVREAEAAGAPLMDPYKVTSENELANEPLKPLPYIVCIIDELADLILLNRKQVENAIVRLAQKARAAGIHLILATQRPSVDIVTPLIKANVAARVCFMVSSRFDSQVVLDEGGAQDLLGQGDMLFRRPGQQMVTRIQGCYVSDEEVSRVVANLKAQGTPDYVDAVTETPEEAPEGAAAAGNGSVSTAGEKDPLYDQAAAVVIEARRASSSYVQRRFGIGYNRAANLIESMERAGIVSKPNAAGKREVLVKPAGGLELSTTPA